MPNDFVYRLKTLNVVWEELVEHKWSSNFLSLLHNEWIVVEWSNVEVDESLQMWS